MNEAEVSLVPVLRAGQLDEDVQGAMGDLYHVLVNITRGSALDKVVNAGEFEGLEAWRQLVQRYDPTLRSRQAGHLLELMN